MTVSECERVPELRATQHRADIDGLRAIAVVPVLMFHAQIPWCPGGSVGVDIFFVISGYLISRIILRDLAQGRFSDNAFLLLPSEPMTIRDLPFWGSSASDYQVLVATLRVEHVATYM
jgi:hypothetical protein